jgi:hypothetical protein
LISKAWSASFIVAHKIAAKVSATWAAVPSRSAGAVDRMTVTRHRHRRSSAVQKSYPSIRFLLDNHELFQIPLRNPRANPDRITTIDI